MPDRTVLSVGTLIAVIALAACAAPVDDEDGAEADETASELKGKGRSVTTRHPEVGRVRSLRGEEGKPQTCTGTLVTPRALITTAAPYQPDKGDQGPGAPYNASAKFYEVYSGDTSKDHDLRISHVAIDRDHTTGEDIGSYFPLQALREAAARGRIGGLTPRFHGAPTNRSQRVTLERDVPELVARCMEEGDA
jgi:hypothetical protein